MRRLAPLALIAAMACAAPPRPAATTADASPGRAAPASYGAGFTDADRRRAERYLAEAAALCTRDGGRLWGVSLCGPIAIVDATTRAIATNEPPPDAARPAAFGFANAAVEWGGRRWTTVMWQQLVYAEEHRVGAGYLLVHELFHRVQPQLGLLLPDPANDHLDTVDGRYWMVLEWRALDAALGSSGTARRRAVRDALTFRAARRAAFRTAAEGERVAEIVEGLADYTAIAVLETSRDAKAAHARRRLAWVLEQPTFVRPFGYGSGAAYGVLLDDWRSDWARRFRPGDDLARLLASAARVEAVPDPREAAARYGARGVMDAEQAREVERHARIAELRRLFVDGPVLIIPRPRRFTFAGDVVPLGDAGSTYPGFRAQEEWGTLEASRVLMRLDGLTITVPAPRATQGRALAGEGWTLTLAPDWEVRPAARAGDLQVVRTPTAPDR